MAGRGHRDVVRVGVSAAEFARAGRRAARVRLAAVQLAPIQQARSLVPAQRTKAPLRARSTGMPNAFATLASSSRGTGTGARGAAPEEQKAPPLAAEAGQANGSAPKRARRQLRIGRACRARTFRPPCLRERETGFPRARSSTRRPGGRAEEPCLGARGRGWLTRGRSGDGETREDPLAEADGGRGHISSIV